MAVSCSLLRDAMEIGAVEGQYLIHGPFGYAMQRWAILSFGVGVFGTDEPVVGRDAEGPTLDWRALVFSFQSAPQGTPHTPDACGDMADRAGTYAKSALSAHPNDPKEALAKFDRDFSRLYVGHSAGGRLGAIKMGAPKPFGRQSRDRKVIPYFLGDTGFKSEFLDKDHDPNNHVKSDQTHHFAAYLTLVSAAMRRPPLLTP